MARWLVRHGRYLICTKDPIRSERAPCEADRLVHPVASCAERCTLEKAALKSMLLSVARKHNAHRCLASGCVVHRSEVHTS